MHNGDALKRHARMAYMDGELPASDRTAFEQALTPEQTRLIAIDKALQGGLVGCLTRIDQCPDALWDRVKSEIGRPNRPVRTRRFVPLSAIAACLVLGLGLLYIDHAASKPIEYQVTFPASVQQFADSASIKGDQEIIEETLHAQGFAVSIGDIATCNHQHQHYVTLLGVNMLEIGKKEYPCAHLRFSCCGQPVSTFVVKESRRITPDSFKVPEPSGTVHQTAHHANGYLIVTMSPHPTVAVASLFDAPAGDIQE